MLKAKKDIPASTVNIKAKSVLIYVKKNNAGQKEVYMVFKFDGEKYEEKLTGQEIQQLRPFVLNVANRVTAIKDVEADNGA